jgi:chemosensory pili system protein ChpA (sensor histidine kinase/response regulator)
MSTTTKFDPNTLGWVKTEIDESLKQAHIALESFAENPSDDTHLRFCVTHLHQVVGTLQMVELDGAAMLGREAEALAEAVLDEQLEPSENLLELITRAILLLPNYLGGLQFGQPDAPIRLLPIMNELRAARKIEPLSELELFAPDLSVWPPPKEQEKDKLDEVDYAALVQKLRPAFQGALLKWLRDNDDAKALDKIAETVTELQDRASVGVVEQLFWVAGGLLEAMGSGGLEATNDRKKLVARLDQQAKKIIDGTEKSALRNTSEALTKAILYELGSASSVGPKVAQLQQLFDLPMLLGRPASEHGTGVAELPEPETVQSVSVALREQVQEAQEQLAAFFDPDQKETDTLEPLSELLHKMSGTMELLGIPTLKALLDELLAIAQAVVNGKLEPTEEISMGMAHALLLIENCSRDIWAPSWKNQIEQWTTALHALHAAEDSTVPDAEGIEVSEVSETEFDQLAGVVADEIRASLIKVEEAVEAYAADTSDPAHLQGIADQMNQIHGALQILGEQRALELSQVISRRVEGLATNELVPSSAVLDALAVCVGTLSAHAEGLRVGRYDIDDLMDAAMNDMDTAISAAELGELDPATLADSIQENVHRWLADSGNTDLIEGLHKDLEQIAVLSKTQNQERIARISTETGALLSIVTENPTQLSTEIRETLERSAEALAGLVRQHLSANVVAAMPAPSAAPGPAASEPITVAAEVAPVSEEMAPPQVVVEAIAPALNEEAGPIEPQMETPTAEKPPVAPPAAAPQRTGARGAEQEAGFDAELLEIFTEEAREVLETIDRELPVWRADPANSNALGEVRRGFHTLKGSGRMVGATDIGELAWAIENLLNKARDRKLEHSEAIFDTIAQAKNVLPAMVAQLEGGPAPDADIAGIRQRAEALSSGEAVAAPAPPADEAQTTQPSAQEPAVAEASEPFPTLEPTLLQIFTGESQEHLDTIAQKVAGCRQSGSACLVSRALLRATHTLGGSARSVGLPPMSEPCGEMEQLLEAMEEAGIPLAEPQLALLSELIECVRGLIELLNTGSGSAEKVRDGFKGLLARIRTQTAQVPATEVGTMPVEEQDKEAQAQPPTSAFEGPAPSAVTGAGEAAAVDSPPAQSAESAAGASATTPAPEAGPSARAATPPSAMIEEDIDPELVDVFLDEATDLVGTIEDALRRWRANQADTQAVEDIKRALHTLKGSARMASAMSVGSLAHNTEDLIKRVEEERIAFSAELFDLLDEVHDTLVTLLDQIRQARPLSSVDVLSTKIARAVAGEPIAAVLDSAPQPSKPSAAMPGDASVQPAPLAATADAPEETGDAASETAAPADRRAEAVAEVTPLPQRRDRRGQVRVRTSLLTDLVNDAGEVSISRARMEQQVYGFRDNLTELNRNITRFGEQLRELEIQSDSQILYRTEQAVDSDSVSGFDPLQMDRYSRLQQLSRGLTESLHDLTTIQGSLDVFAGEAETVLQQQARINTSLQEGLMRTRLIAFSTQAARLRHIARQTARELGKRVELRITGADVDVDRNVLERMMGPFEHMIRNALDHGIENEEERQRAGKSPVGAITIDTSQEGNEIAIRFSDDGAGFDIDAIRRRAIENGLMAEDKTLSDEELIQFILVAGFSTAREVTHLSGRGVGMDVVENEVKQLGGSMAVSSTQGEGTTFIIHLPVTLSIMQALLIRAGDQTLAVPLSAVLNIIEVPTDQMNVSMGKNPLLSYNDQVYSFMDVAARLGLRTEHRNGGKIPVLLAKVGTREVAIQVDGLMGTKEIVVKTLGPQLSELKGLAGATILGDGAVILILDLGGLWLTGDTIHVERVESVAPREQVKRRPVVMVVDDSLTVRKVTGRHLQKRGLEVLTAKDGVDALEQLENHSVDAMLVDIEMPRMDGYELTKRLRADARFKHTPIIIITSRAGEIHRKRAFELGVNMYMSKPYQEDELFNNIESLLPEETVH